MSTRCLPGELRRPACVFAGVHIRHLFYSGREASPARLQVILSNTKPCPCSATVCWHFGSPLVGVGCSSKKSPGPQKSVTGQRKTGWLFHHTHSPSSHLFSFSFCQVNSRKGLWLSRHRPFARLGTELTLAEVIRDTKNWWHNALALFFLFSLSVHIYGRMRFSFKISVLERLH